MRKQNRILFAGYLISSAFCSCSNAQPQKEIIKSKNSCYASILKKNENDSLYLMVMAEFKDTFNVMKNEKQYFGVSSIEKRIDEAIFFNKARTECLLIVLIKNNNNLVFGDARIVRGQMRQGKWSFKPSKEYTFTNGYYQLYPENNFENLSQLARYSILVDGEVKIDGCDIDENYWFVHLKQ